MVLPACYSCYLTAWFSLFSNWFVLPAAFNFRQFAGGSKVSSDITASYSDGATVGRVWYYIISPSGIPFFVFCLLFYISACVTDGFAWYSLVLFGSACVTIQYPLLGRLFH